MKRKRSAVVAAGMLLGILSTNAGTISNDLVVHLKFEDNYLDSSGNNLNGEAVGVPGFAAGKIGQALTFSTLTGSGEYNYVTLGAPPELNFGGSTDFSISFWVKFTTLNGDPALVGNKDWNSGGNQGWIIATDDDGHLQWNFKESGSGRKDYDGPPGALSNGQWHHVVVTFDRDGNATTYLDGLEVDSRSIGPGTDTIDTPEGYATNIGQDGGGFYSSGIEDGMIDDLGIWKRVLSAGEVLRIYEAGQNGIALGDVPDPTTPIVTSASIVNGATGVVPSIVFLATIEDAATAVVPGSIKLTLDGAAVTPEVTTDGITNTVRFDYPGLFASGSQHTFQLVFGDNGTPQTLKTNDYAFTVLTYENRTLPAPLHLETFDTTARGELPAGWSVQNYTTPMNPGIDYLDPTSDAYLDWVVISRDDILAGDWDAPRRLNVAPGQVINGEEITALLVNNFMYAESDSRGSGSQIQILTTPDYDLTGKENIVLSYHSAYEQNQDSIGLVEYSIDEGTTWHPVVYMIDQVDIITGEGGEIDAVATLSEIRGDQPYYYDEFTGEQSDGSYGGLAKAPISQDLAPFISGRVDDNAVESKRVEIFPLPLAANQPKVRVRFVYGGVASWYWGLDNIGIYSLAAATAPTIETQPVSATATELGNVELSVSASGTPPLSYQWQKEGENIPGATSAIYTLARVSSADAGKYRVVVSNAGGSITSDEATITVTPLAPSVVTGQWDFNDGDLNATIGSPLQYRGDTETVTTFSTLQINGTDAAVMGFPAIAPEQGYVMPHGASPNGGGTFVNEYTLIMDVMYPAESDFAWRALWQTSESNANDGDMFVNTANGIGISSGYHGTVVADTWHRLVFVFDLPNSRVAKYIDGALVNVQTLGSGRDGRWSLGETALIFTDEDGETAAGFVNSIQFRSGLMTDAQVLALGGATAEGIPGGEAPLALSIQKTETGFNILVEGAGSVQLQRKTALSDATWENVGAPTTDRTIPVTAAGATGFFRVLKQ